MDDFPIRFCDPHGILYSNVLMDGVRFFKSQRCENPRSSVLDPAVSVPTFIKVNNKTDRLQGDKSFLRSS
jgi:hypothetical protein